MAEASASRLSPPTPRLVQPRPGPAGDRPAARRAAPRHPGGDRPGRSGVRPGPGHSGSCAGGRRALQPALPARESPRSTPPKRLHLRRRPRLAHPRRGRPGPDQPRPLPARLHRLRGAARHLQALHRDPDPARRSDGLRFSVDDLRREILGRGLVGAAPLESLQPDRQGPCRARSWSSWVRAGARARLRAADRRVLLPLRLDRPTDDERGLVSAARYVEDVDADPVVLFDGLTKNWRYPGWRCTWIVGPQGGDRGGLQQRLLPRRRRQQAAAARGGPAARRRAGGGARPRRSARRSSGSARSSARACSEAGVRFDLEPEGTFYCWGDVSALPPGINDGMSFFRAALEREGDLRPGRVLRHQPRQAAERAAVAVPAVRAILLRAGRAFDRRGGEEDSGDGGENEGLRTREVLSTGYSSTEWSQVSLAHPAPCPMPRARCPMPAQ